MLVPQRNKASIVFGACILIGFGLTVLDASNRTLPRSVGHQDSKHYQYTAEKRSNPSSAVQIDCDPNCTASHAVNNRNQSAVSQFINRLFEDPLTIATIILVLVVVVQVRDARQSSNRQLRAYVLLGTSGDILYSPSTKFAGATFQMHNFGQTPAAHMYYAARMKVLPYPLTQSAFLQFPVDIQVASAKSKIFLGPNGDAAGNVASEEKFTPAEMNEIFRAQDFKFYIFGLIKYKDIFGAERTTKFCHSVHGDIDFSGLHVGQFIPPGPQSTRIEHSAIDNEFD